MQESKKNEGKIDKWNVRYCVAYALPMRCPLGATSCLLLDLLRRHDFGCSLKHIYSQLDKKSISRRTIRHNLKYLIENGLLWKESLLYGITDRATLQTQGSKWTFTTQEKQIELHNISFVVSIKNAPIWWDNRQEMLFRYKLGTIEPVKWGNNQYQKIDQGDFIIQVFENSFVFISKVRYHAADPYECFTKAVDNYLKAYNGFEEIIRFSFNYDEPPTVKVKSSHYVMINDAIAKHCKKTGDKFAVEIDGSIRVWVDMSEPLGMEAGDADHALGDIAQYQDFVKDLLLHPDLPKYSDHIKMFNSHLMMFGAFLQENASYAENLKTHVASIKELANQVNLFGSHVKNHNELNAKQLQMNQQHHEVMKGVSKLLNKVNSKFDKR